MTPRAAFWRGVTAGPATPGIVLLCSVVGFGALAHELGLTLPETIFMTAIMWALPGQVVLVSEIGAGAPLWSAAIAVTLTAVRLLPLTVVLMPILRGERTGKAHQLALSHFVAVTIWTESMHRLPHMPREERVPYYWGFSLCLMGGSFVALVLGHTLTAALGATITAGLLFLTPLYFTLSMHRASSVLADRLALLFGLALGPVVFLLLPGFELVLSGVVGGTVAYLIGRAVRRRAA